MAGERGQEALGLVVRRVAEDQVEGAGLAGEEALDVLAEHLRSGQPDPRRDLVGHPSVRPRSVDAEVRRARGGCEGQGHEPRRQPGEGAPRAPSPRTRPQKVNDARSSTRTLR